MTDAPTAPVTPILVFDAGFLDLLAGELFDTIAVIITDLDGIVTHWNRFAETLYGWSAAEAIGARIETLTVGPVTSEVAEAIMARLRSGVHWSGSFEARRRDGGLISVNVLDAPVVDSDGSPVGIVGLSRESSQQFEQALHELNDLRDFAGRLDEVRRDESRRIAAQIHDEFSQRFHLLIQRTAAMAESLGDGDPVRVELDGLLDLERELVAVMHSVCGALRPPLLDELGAAVALEHLVSSVGGLGLAVQSAIDPGLEHADAQVAEVVLAIVQEALSNVMAHAHSPSCTVTVTVEGDLIELVVADDGVGHRGRSGFGTRLMAERARRVGGTLTIEPGPDGGTVVAARLPAGAPVTAH